MNDECNRLWMKTFEWIFLVARRRTLDDGKWDYKTQRLPFLLFTSGGCPTVIVQCTVRLEWKLVCLHFFTRFNFLQPGSIFRFQKINLEYELWLRSGKKTPERKRWDDGSEVLKSEDFTFCYFKGLLSDFEAPPILRWWWRLFHFHSWANFAFAVWLENFSSVTSAFLFN